MQFDISAVLRYSLIPENKLKSNKRLLVAEHNMNEEQKQAFLSAIPHEFNIKEVTPIGWIKNNTNLEEIEE